MDLGIQQKTAVVGASTGGLGLAIGQALGREGANVVLCGRRGEVAQEEAAKLPQAIGVSADLTAPDGPRQVIEAAERTFGPVDVLVTNTGGPPAGAAAQVETEDLQAAVDQLLLPVQRLVGLVLPGMRERGWGRILAVVSSGVVQPIPHLALSNTVRAAVTGYLKTLAGEVAGEGVTVNLLVPGRIATERLGRLDEAKAGREGLSVAEVRAASQAAIPAGRYGRPQEFADVAAFLCGTGASYVTGAQIRVDGGLIASH